jgi:hypothetical protein
MKQAETVEDLMRRFEERQTLKVQKREELQERGVVLPAPPNRAERRRLERAAETADPRYL